MAVAVRFSQNIQDIKSFSSENKITLYTGDALFVISFTESHFFPTSIKYNIDKLFGFRLQGKKKQIYLFRFKYFRKDKEAG